MPASRRAGRIHRLRLPDQVYVHRLTPWEPVRNMPIIRTGNVPSARLPEVVSNNSGCSVTVQHSLGRSMGRFSALWHLAGKWYVSGLLLAGLGIVLGSTVFFYVWPGKPKIGIIDIPFTVFSDQSAFEIGAMLEFAQRDDSIDGVVISISSPGGGAAVSEQLFFETAKLREKKPVVFVMNDLVASGGYMMALGGNYSYAQPSTLVAGIGVILSGIPPLIPRLPDERDVFTGPFKAEGGDRRHFVALTDQLRQSFAQLVLTQRGDRLRMPLREVIQGNVYSGVEGLRLGLVDAIGSTSDAIEKAASLANISGYDLVDINTEVSRDMNRKLQRVREPLQESGLLAAIVAQRALSAGPAAAEGTAADLIDPGLLPGGLDTGVLRTLPLPGGIGEDPGSALPDFPLKINGPSVYYLYVGPSP